MEKIGKCVDKAGRVTDFFSDGEKFFRENPQARVKFAFVGNEVKDYVKNTLKVPVIQDWDPEESQQIYVAELTQKQYKQVFDVAENTGGFITQYRAPAAKNPPEASVENPKTLFPLGKTMMTAGVNELIANNAEFAGFVMKSLGRHASGDWGDLDAADKQSNEESLHLGERLLSTYNYQAKGFQKKIWIISEWDRSITTVLFPDEY